MSPPLNPYAKSFQPRSSSSSLNPFIQLPNATFPPLSSLLPPPDFHPHPVLPQYPVQVPPPPPFYQHKYPPQEQICYGFPPPTLPPTKLISDYTHHGSMMIMALKDLALKDLALGLNFYEGKQIGTGCFLKASTGRRSRRCSKKQLQLSPPPPSHHRGRQIRSSSTSSCCTTKKKQWQPKSMVVVNGGGGGGGAALASAANVVAEVPRPPPFLSGQVQQFGSKTSVMLRNIPNRYCRDMLLELLVDHCKEENDKEINPEVSKSAFDFVYLPIDFETECNKGYAFVNFTNPNGVWRLYNYLNYHKWDVFNSRKICEVTYAKIQGKDALIKHFNRSTFACEKDDYLPVYFNPFLDGSAQDEAVEMFTVGTRTTRLLPSSSSQHHSILRRGDHDENEKKGEDGQPRTI